MQNQAIFALVLCCLICDERNKKWQCMIYRIFCSLEMIFEESGNMKFIHWELKNTRETGAGILTLKLQYVTFFAKIKE